MLEPWEVLSAMTDDELLDEINATTHAMESAVWRFGDEEARHCGIYISARSHYFTARRILNSRTR